ncbi:MAG: MFS transporter, partial [Neisseriaceae bacterium]
NINWKITFGLLILLCTIFITLIYQLPCSPAWLFRKGKYTESINALLITHTRVESEKIIGNWHTDKKMQKLAYVFQAKYFKALILVVTVTCLNQLTGINAILQTSTILISNSGLANHAALLGSIGLTAVNVLGTLIGITVVDRFPRNKLLGVCGIIIAIAHFIIAINFFYKINSPIVLIGGLLLFILSYAIGPGIIIWLVFSEYLPLPVRSQGIAVAGFINAIAGFLISSLFLYLGKTYSLSWIFLTCSICSFIYGLIPLFYLPNTTGKDIENFEKLFTKE